MKTKEYVEKYKLSESNKFDHSAFVADFAIEFMTLLEVGNSTKNMKGFENAVRAIRTKWDAISNKTMMGLPDKLWGYFYATVIAKMKEELFSTQLNKLRAEKAERDKRKAEFEKLKEERFGYSSNFYKSFLSSILFASITAERCLKEFEILGLSSSSTVDDVNKKYRELCMTHHPDKGGKQDKFIEITEAKNKLLMFLNR